jgi:hypothetical protein
MIWKVKWDEGEVGLIMPKNPERYYEAVRMAKLWAETNLDASWNKRE